MKGILAIWNKISDLGISSSLDKNTTRRVRLMNQVMVLAIIASAMVIPFYLIVGNHKMLLTVVISFSLYSIGLYLSYIKNLKILDPYFLFIGIFLMINGTVLIGKEAPFYLFIFPFISILFYLYRYAKLSKFQNLIVILSLIAIIFIGLDFSDLEKSIMTLCFILVSFGIHIVIMWVFFTESKKSNQTILNSQRMLNEAQIIASVGSWEYDYATRKVKRSEHLKEMFDFHAIEFDLNKHFFSLLPKDKQAILLYAMEHKDDPKGFDFKYTLTQKGEEKSYRIIGKKLLNHLGKTEKLIGTIQDITTEVKKDQEIAYLYSYAQATLESTADGILVVGSDGKISRFNQRFIEMWRVPEEVLASKDDAQAIGFVLSQLSNPNQFITKVEELYNTPNAKSFDTLYFKDERVFERYSQPQIVNNQVVGRVWSFRDVTDEVKVAKALERSEVQYRTIFEKAFDGILIHNIKTMEIIDCNQKIVEYFGLNTKEEFIKLKPFNTAPKIQPDGRTTRELMREQMKAALEKEEFHYEIQLKRPNGSLFFTEVSGIRLPLEKEGTFVSIFKDITAQKLHEKSIKAQADYLKMIIDLNPCFIFAKNRDGVFTLANKAVAKNYGTTPENLIGKTDYDFNDNHDEVEYFIEMDHTVFDLKEAIHIPYEEITTSTGKVEWLQTTKTPILDANGVCNELMGVSTIISDRVKTERALLENEKRIKKLLEEVQLKNEELEAQSYILSQTNVSLKRSNRELEQFAYVASHDLQEPLRMVGNFVQLLEMDYVDLLDDEGKIYIGYVVDGVTRMSKLIDDLLEYSRVGRKEMAISTINLEEVVKTKIHDLKIRIKEKNAQVVINKLPNSVQCEPNLLGVVFFNLIGNAIKFNTNPNPKVTIDVRERKREWVFSIQDNGIGIEEKNKDKIFEIFKRLHRKEIYKGTGIGLALCKRIVLRHKGKIWFKSKLGHGSIFYFTIPKNLDMI